MKYYKATIFPKSPFATPPMSDTLFGQLIWMLNDLGEDVAKMLATYDSNPCFVVSDFIANNQGVAPKMPTTYNLGKSKMEKIQEILDRKELKKRSKIDLDKLYKMQKIDSKKIIDNSIKKNHDEINETVHCSLNRLTGTTGNGFDPYSVIETVYKKDTFFTCYFYVSENEHVEKIKDALILMGKIGFGKDASIGKGRFSVDKFEEINFSHNNKNSIYTLGNVVLDGINDYKNCYYEIFTRFGKHGNILSVTGNPYKNPVVMAKQGALITDVSDKLFEKPFIGKSLKGLSYHQETVHQGYSLYVPIDVEV
ncbi:protein of unknown function DUF324 [Flexistipes sinusarabici DSM 4947]|uniref:CRISPR system Cms protein Csm4 n=1 Tax=Flexistipes sinusarabici (strain ATCC 49648 / DSM 4947 / MAS 10) TaxID=717231 RepID=F8E7K3_FLESM|nr:hypothetical protein [Flexistipes sinusarabici]AEI14990.1 protein of unknown function DUF324 [Flexistipes sinusarabici DSM 4947]